MKRLFEVAGEFFPSKGDAKAVRDDLNRMIDPEKPEAMCKVRLGPDHWRYSGKAMPIINSK